MTQAEFDKLDAVTIHLVDHETKTRALCTGAPWTTPGGASRVKLCRACLIATFFLNTQKGTHDTSETKR